MSILFTTRNLLHATPADQEEVLGEGDITAVQDHI